MMSAATSRPRYNVEPSREVTRLSLQAHRDKTKVRELLEQHTDYDALVAFSTRNRVGPIVAHAALEAGVSHVALQRLHDDSENRMNILLTEVDGVASRLGKEGIRVVALKNAGISRGIYPCPACCPMGDADLLVARGRFHKAHQVMLACGYTLASRSRVEPADLELGFASGGTEYVRKVESEEVWIELQWRPIAGRWIRKDQEPDGAGMIARSVPIPGTDVRLLDPSDNMLQVCLHTAKHSYVRAPGIRLHTDVDRLVAYAPPDWDRVVAMASQLRVKTPVYFSLSCAVELMGTPVPENVLDRLAPPAWKRKLVMAWLRKADFYEPDQKKFSRPGMMVFHALLYDDLRGFLASVMNTDRDGLGLKHLPANIARGARRVYDLATRYQR